MFVRASSQSWVVASGNKLFKGSSIHQRPGRLSSIVKATEYSAAVNRYKVQVS